MGAIRDGQSSKFSDEHYMLMELSVNSIVLLTNGISFALQAVILLVVGAWADYGRWRYAIPHTRTDQLFMEISIHRPNITIFFTIMAVAVSFAWLGVEEPSKWRAGVALYILGRKYPQRLYVFKLYSSISCFHSDCVSGVILQTDHTTIIHFPDAITTIFVVRPDFLDCGFSSISTQSSRSEGFSLTSSKWKQDVSSHVDLFIFTRIAHG